MVHLITCHSKFVLEIAVRHRWLPGARYTNLRDIREFNEIGFIDIDWKNYDFDMHLWSAKKIQPLLTIARDLESAEDLDTTIFQAEKLLKYCREVCIVPKDRAIEDTMERIVPKKFLFAYSVPTKYGGTEIPAENFKRPTHLLGGCPDVQRALAKKLNVFSVDVNRSTLDARFGDYFDGRRFLPHPVGGYARCLEESIVNITDLWRDRHEPQ